MLAKFVVQCKMTVREVKMIEEMIVPTDQFIKVSKTLAFNVLVPIVINWKHSLTIINFTVFVAISQEAISI